MKKIYLSIYSLLTVSLLSAQVSQLEFAPNFTAEDTNGESWNLFGLLNENKVVILNFFTTWDNSSWEYRETGALESFYQSLGPAGSNEVVVLNIESESLNAFAQLQGPQNLTGNYSDQTWGDWLSGANIPTIDQTAIADSFLVNQIPTLVMICPDGSINELSLMGYEDLLDAYEQRACPIITEGLDVAVVSVDVLGECGSNLADVHVTVRSLGTETMSGFDYFLTGGVSPINASWSGSLDTYEFIEFVFEDVVLNPHGMVAFSIVSGDENNLNDVKAGSSDIKRSSLLLRLELALDNWPEEVSWEIRNENNEVVYEDGDFTVAYQYFETDYALPADGCYSFYLYDSGGDGLHGSQWGGFDGSCKLYALNDQDGIVSLIYNNDGSYNFSEAFPSESFEQVDFLANSELSNHPTMILGNDNAVQSVEVLRECESNLADILVTVRNLGTEYSNAFDYEFAGVANNATGSWSGDLFSSDAVLVQFTDVELNDQTEVSFRITNEDLRNNNNLLSTPSRYIETSSLLHLVLNLDDRPEEISWDIKNENEEIIYSGNNYSNSNETIVQDFTLTQDGCYSFTLYDAGGDGLHSAIAGGNDGGCYLMSTYDDGVVKDVIYSYDGSELFTEVLPSSVYQRVSFNAVASLQVTDAVTDNLLVYPNPADQFTRIFVGEMNAGECVMELFDLHGRQIAAYAGSKISDGQKSLILSTNELAEGFYHVKITNGNSSKVSSLVVLH